MSRGPITSDERSALERFRVEVCARAAEIDHGDEFEWYDLSIGFFIACGLSIDSAAQMALHARYDLHYWEASS